ncbi:MAG: GMP synthase subunit A [Thermoplasmatota archaeon]
MVSIYVIDNGGQWTHREWRMLKYLDVNTKIVPNTTPWDELVEENVDGLILSGGAPRIGLENKLGNCDEYLRKGDIPILGICAGHQLMARFFGGDAKPSKIPEFGKITLTLIDEQSPLFIDVPKESIVWESHNDEITKLPENMKNLAKSENCLYQAIMHKTKPFFGLQFHPEVNNTEYGEQIFSNFKQICETH